MPRIGIGLGIGRQRFAGGFADSYSARVLADGGTIEALSCVANASTLLQQASLLFIPSGYKAGVAYSALPNNGNGDLTWTRNSTANRTNLSGVIESVGANVPRLSYMYGSCPSALLEPQRTNLVLRSEEFDNASWGKTNASVTANATTSPDGNSTADKLIGTGNNPLINFQGITINGVVATISVYAKKSELNWLRITNGQATYAAAWFDLNNGVVGTVSGTGVPTARIVNAGNGWYRCSITVTFDNTQLGDVIFACTNADNTTTGYTGNGTDGIFIWGAQLEQGSYATTYIPTTTATATRLADTFTRNNIYTNGLIGASGGTWYVELKNNVAYARDTVQRVFGIGDSNTSINNGFVIRPNSAIAERYTIEKYISGIRTGLETTALGNAKIAIKWNGSTADVFQNGVKIVSATTFGVVNMEFINGTGVDSPKFIQQMALFNTVLSDSDCITLTT